MNEEKRKIQLEALAALEKNNYNGIVLIPTGGGKSYVLIESLRRLYKPGMKVLYTCDSRRLRDEDFNAELQKWGCGKYCDLIDRECYASACKKKEEHYDVLLADEGDASLSPIYANLYRNNTFTHIIFVSATLEANKRTMAKEIAPIIYEKKLKEIEEREVVNKSQLYYVPYRLSDKENNEYLKFNSRYTNLLKQPDSKNRAERLKFLTFERIHFLAGLESSVYICKKLLAELRQKANARILVFCASTDQADKICEYSYHGKNEKDDNLNKFNNGEIQEAAVCGKINRGVNLNGVNHIIMESVTNSETRSTQQTGRGKRLPIDEILSIYFPVPYYTKPWAKNTPFPTIVLRKITNFLQKYGNRKR